MRNRLHLLGCALLVILAAGVLLPAPAAAGDRAVSGTKKMQAAERQILRDINRIRVRNGRKRLRFDKRTSYVARARSADMAAKRYFAHVEPDGDDAGRILNRRGISAAEVTENIGHTFGFTLRRGRNSMARWWYRSPPHRMQMLARDINYVGIGIARRGSRFTYTAIFTRSPDKTPPQVVMDEPTVSDDGSSVIIGWHGVDPKLAAGSSGIRRFEFEHFNALGGWAQVGGDSSRSERSFGALGTDDRFFRVRAIDKAGNTSPWAYARADVSGGLPRENLAQRRQRPR